MLTIGPYRPMGEWSSVAAPLQTLSSSGFAFGVTARGSFTTSGPLRGRSTDVTRYTRDTGGTDPVVAWVLMMKNSFLWQTTMRIFTRYEQRWTLSKTILAALFQVSQQAKGHEVAN